MSVPDHSDETRMNTLDTLLGKIAGFFEKDFLFASLLPSLIFVPAMLITLAYVVDIDTVVTWLSNWSLVKKTGFGFVGIVALIVFAYVLSALRATLLRLWSGTSKNPLLWGFF